MVNWKRPTRADIIAAVTPIAEQRGLVVRYVDADDPDCEDDSVDLIGRDGAEHDVSIQVCLSGGFSYTVFENGEDGGSYWQGEAVDNPADAAKAGFAKYDELGGAEAPPSPRSTDARLNPALQAQVATLRGGMIGAAEAKPFPARFSAVDHPDRAAMVITDAETGRSHIVSLYAYGAVRDTLQAFFCEV